MEIRSEERLEHERSVYEMIDYCEEIVNGKYLVVIVAIFKAG